MRKHPEACIAINREADPDLPPLPCAPPWAGLSQSERARVFQLIGSGATAVTLVPAMADRAAHVTMQRSPSYVVPVPRREHPRPTLIVWGDRDRILPAHHLTAASGLLPHAETFLFAGIGHMPQIECPDKFAELVLGFLATATHR